MSDRSDRSAEPLSEDLEAKIEATLKEMGTLFYSRSAGCSLKYSEWRPILRAFAREIQEPLEKQIQKGERLAYAMMAGWAARDTGKPDPHGESGEEQVFSKGWQWRDDQLALLASQQSASALAASVLEVPAIDYHEGPDGPGEWRCRFCFNYVRAGHLAGKLLPCITPFPHDASCAVLLAMEILHPAHIEAAYHRLIPGEASAPDGDGWSPRRKGTPGAEKP
jgi:hypothetical protein